MKTKEGFVPLSLIYLIILIFQFETDFFGKLVVPFFMTER